MEEENKKIAGIGPGIFGLDPDGKVCLIPGGFPGTTLASEGKILPIEQKTK